MLDEYEALLAYEEASLMDIASDAPASQAWQASPLSPPTTAHVIERDGSRRTDGSAYRGLGREHPP